MIAIAYVLACYFGFIEFDIVWFIVSALVSESGNTINNITKQKE